MSKDTFRTVNWNYSVNLIISSQKINWNWCKLTELKKLLKCRLAAFTVDGCLLRLTKKKSVFSKRLMYFSTKYYALKKLFFQFHFFRINFLTFHTIYVKLVQRFRFSPTHPRYNMSIKYIYHMRINHIYHMSINHIYHMELTRYTLWVLTVYTIWVLTHMLFLLLPWGVFCKFKDFIISNSSGFYVFF